MKAPPTPTTSRYAGLQGRAVLVTGGASGIGANDQRQAVVGDMRAAGGGSSGVTPEAALRGWRSSQGHHEVLINKGIWASSKWQAMGVAITDRHALVWFGEAADASSRP